MKPIYANTAAVGQLHPAARTEMRQALSDLAQPDFYGGSYPRWTASAHETRELIAKLLGVSSSSIALTSSTSDGLAMFETALPLSPGDVVAVNPGAFISVGASLLRLQAAGIAVVPIGEENGRVCAHHLSATPRRTRLVVMDWVNYWSGYRNDVQPLVEWCRRANIPLLLDAVQAIGAVRVDFDLEGVAGLACGGHKWLRGPEGAGFLYIAPWMLPRLTPRHHGYRSLANPQEIEARRLELSVDARVFEVGTMNTIGFAGLAAAVRSLLAKGVSRTAERIANTVEAVYDTLRELPDVELATPAERNQRAGIISFRSNAAPAAELVRRLSSEGLIVGSRRGWVRISPAATAPPEGICDSVRRVFVSRCAASNL